MGKLVDGKIGVYTPSQWVLNIAVLVSSTFDLALIAGIGYLIYKGLHG